MSLAFAACLALLSGCSSGPDLYDRMNRAAQPEQGLQQTQLAHIGHIETTDGRFEVCFQRLVVTGMLAPRGQSRLLIFSKNGYLVRSFDFPSFQNPPLWCDSGRVYLFGNTHIPGLAIDPAIADRFTSEEVLTGNVIDFSRGIDHAILTREKMYGSSGGIEDNL
jgi:hypothetical protein